nr:hypothetical protein [Rhizobium sp. SG741]
MEHNVSVETIKRHKRSSLGRLATMTELVRHHVPEFGDGAQMFCLMSLLSAGAASAYAPPPPSLLAAYKDEPALGALHMELRDALRASFTSTLLGALSRANRASASQRLICGDQHQSPRAVKTATEPFP